MLIKSSTSFKSQIKSAYGRRCLFCHKTENVHVAHLISHNDTQDYTVFNRPRYISDFDPISERKRILLCGTKAERGTCHNLFDCHNITMFYDGFTRTYKAVVVKADDSRPEFPENRIIDLVFLEGFDDRNLPFLAWEFECVL